ncbi:hypothetical protein BC962_3264 [Gillisia mitskevichiae]|uniref:Tetratricopeptide repeat protein n=1 Tax=Gillisia mitskevichiae TaxID=270921 RepID=A0A495NXC0_9FLAO|nr:hypothetical protein [Gillisia mitskevichiae]RKS42506.1 hypothetical protein BC962_3264 [Gillisia mitskevichiae]
MNNKILIILFLIPVISFSQSEKIENSKNQLFSEMSIDVCNCLNDETPEMEFHENCLNDKKSEYKKKYEDLLTKESVIGSDSIKEEWKEEFITTILTGSMVYECDKWYNYFKNIKNKTIGEIYKNANPKQLDSLNRLEPEFRNDNFYYDRGALNFASKHYLKAIEDISKHNEINPTNQTYLFLAWVYEASGNLEKSLDAYDQIQSSQDSGMEIELYKSVMKREYAEKELTNQKKALHTTSVKRK